MKQKVCHVNMGGGIAGALKNIALTLGDSSQYDIVLFCASINYNFEELSKAMKDQFPNAVVMGCSTCGEISPDGFTDGGIVVAGITCPGSKVSGVLLEGAHKFLYASKNQIENAAAECGISRDNSKNSFALIFVNALFNAEENVLAVLHAVLGNGFPVVGGSAGDDLQFSKTYVSLDGKVANDGVAILFVRTNEKFHILRENIFRSTGKVLNITEADTENRKIISIDGQNPTRRYAQILGVSENELKENMELQMMGRVFGSHIFVSSIQGFNSDGTINLYSRLLPNTPVEVLEPVDIMQTVKATCDTVLKNIPRPGVVFMVNCIQRTIRFKNQHIDAKIRDVYNNAFHESFIGFTSYGEQINRIHSNSTFVILAVEE